MYKEEKGMLDVRSRFLLQILIYLITTYIAFGIWGCTYNKYESKPFDQSLLSKPEAGDRSTRSKQAEPAKITAKSDQLLVKGISLPVGKRISIEPGQQSVSFNGLLIRPFSIKHKLSGVETAKFLGCLAFLPICALTHQDILPTEVRTRYQEYHCSGEATFEVNSEGRYEVNLVNAIDSLPVLRISDVTNQPYIVVEKFIQCEPKKGVGDN